MRFQTRIRTRLTKRDRQALQDAALFRMITRESVQASSLAGSDMNAVQSMLRRLYGRPPHYLYLRPEDLDGKRVYYRLTGRGARLIGASKDSARRLGVKAKIRRYALLWFIRVHRPGKRTLFNPRDFPQKFNLHGQRLMRQQFYIEEVSPTNVRLGYLVIDHGADPRRLIRQAGDTMARFFKHGWFDAYIRAGAFVLAVLTIEEKCDELDRLIRAVLANQLRVPIRQLGFSSDHGLPFVVEVVAVPGLAEIIPGLR
jgi:hypothetical protein